MSRKTTIGFALSWLSAWSQISATISFFPSRSRNAFLNTDFSARLPVRDDIHVTDYIGIKQADGHGRNIIHPDDLVVPRGVTTDLDFDLLPGTIGGVTVSVMNLGGDFGSLTLTGDITQFSIGGQELWIDDVLLIPGAGALAVMVIAGGLVRGRRRRS